MDYIISGIQQMGIGVRDTDEAWKWYRKFFRADVPIFEERAEAALMLPYTGGEPRSRYAVLALNLQGGGGFEIWQYTSRTPQPPAFDIQLGDLGFYACKIKSRNVQKTFEFYQSEGAKTFTAPQSAPNGQQNFFVQDPYGNVFQIVEGDDWFQTGKGTTGGVYGSIIGVSDIDKSLPFYQKLLGYDEVIYDKTDNFACFTGLPSGDHQFRRVLLRHSKPRVGAFSRLLGASEIELVQVIGRTPEKMFKDRMWGDLGFIHLCLDIKGMDNLKAKAAEMGYPMTVDSGDFDMGDAAGRFMYNEDPDGTLIEYVEAYKIPVLKKLGLFINLKNRKPEKALPTLMLKALALNRKKD
ncbi:MAG: VOC family protein [Saprospiraceae bacterium]